MRMLLILIQRIRAMYQEMDSAATADTLSVTRTIILLAVLMISAGVICLTLYRRKENA